MWTGYPVAAQLLEQHEISETAITKGDNPSRLLKTVSNHDEIRTDHRISLRDPAGSREEIR